MAARWTEAELQILRQQYPDGQTSVLSERLGRSVDSVHSQASLLGIARSANAIADHKRALAKRRRDARPRVVHPMRIDEILSIVVYDPLTGFFTWRHGSKSGRRAGLIQRHGYRTISLRKHRYYEHRLAFAVVYGRWPSMIDHVNGDRSDNRLENLREATPSQNSANSKQRSSSLSGMRGVYLERKTGRWYSHITFRGQVFNLGRFGTKDEARIAYVAAKHKLFAEFARI